MSVTIKGLRNKFRKLKEAFESKGLEDNVKVSGSTTRERLSKCWVYTYGACTLRVKDNSVLCLQCGKRIHGGCAEVKRVTPKFSRNFACKKYKGNVGEAVENEKFMQ